MSKKTVLALLAVPLAGIASCTALTFTVGGAGSAQALTCAAPSATIAPAADTGTATSTAPAAPSAGALPASIGAYRGEQVTNAATIVVTGDELGLGAQAQAIALMTAIGESSLINLDRGDAAGPDSRGLFQQRDNGAWGTYEDRMNPRTASTNFYNALVDVDGWESMAPTLAAHAVQRNADPYHYEPYWADAVTIVSTLTADPDLASKLPATGGTPCAPGQVGAIAGPGGTFPPQSCTEADPTVDGGCLTPRALNIANQLLAQGWTLSCWDEHAWNPTSDHPKGRACDVFPGTGGQMPTAAEKARGDALAAAVQATAAQTGVSYIIWYGQIWSVDRADEGWRPYTGGGVYDPGSITGGHYDHVHISVY